MDKLPEKKLTYSEKEKMSKLGIFRVTGHNGAVFRQFYISHYAYINSEVYGLHEYCSFVNRDALPSNVKLGDFIKFKSPKEAYIVDLDSEIEKDKHEDFIIQRNRK